MSNTLCSSGLNNAFTFRLVPSPKKEKDKRTAFALRVARDRHEWSQADFARKLNISDQLMTNWVTRGIPRKEWPHVSKILGITVEELDRCKLSQDAPEVPQEALDFAMEVQKLHPVFRSQIQALVRMLAGGPGHDPDTDVQDRPTLQRR